MSTMSTLDALREALPDAARDIKLNLQTLLTGPSSLSEAQRWGVALASAYASREARVVRALLDHTRAAGGDALVEDAKAAAVLMGMNNVYYRFRHLIDKPAYAQKPARLRMNRLGQPSTNKVDFELFSLSVSAINGCGACMQAHEKVVLEGGLRDEQVHDAIRVASTVHAAAVALFVADENAADTAAAA